MTLLLAVLIGVIAGCRALTAPTAVSFAARFGGLHLAATPLAFLGYMWTPWILGLLAIAELVTDKLPTTPSRKAPPGFAARLLTGGLSGAAIGAAHDMLLGGLVVGVAGAIIGTLGGSAARACFAAAFSRDVPAAIIEDVIAIIGAAVIVVLVA
jgi:uncharacterized membrane protein